MSADPLRTPLQFIKGIGPRRADELRAAGLEELEDLLLRLPIRYEDRSRFQPIGGVKPGETISVAGEVLSSGIRSTRRRGFRIFELLLGDRSGQIRAVFFNQSFLKDVLAVHQQVVLFGTVDQGRSGGLQMTNPKFELVGTDSSGHDESESAPIHTGRLVPIYERVGSITPKMMRRLVHDALGRVSDPLDEPLPRSLIANAGLPDRRTALADSHFPPPGSSIDQLNEFRTPAQQRLIFEEFFTFHLGLALKRREIDAGQKPCTIRVNDRVRRAALEVLPFRLTGGQKHALKEIVDDLCRGQAMNRLLQGDVGSGKTIVAALAALVVMENGYQVAVMSPTELLAEQHFLTLSTLLERSRFTPVLLTGRLGAAARRDVAEALATGQAQLVVGTHALVQETVAFKTLQLIIIDEQHRFGVVQRATLREKGKARGQDPDVLVMTATPIPRTLAMTAYGDLDTSVIRELPPGRQPVKTRMMPDSGRDEVYRFVRREVGKGRQAYIVYPLVEESEKVDLNAATEMAEHLAVDPFRDHCVALVHGRLQPDERDAIFHSFVAGRVDVLVATTVVEVGVDVPNASVMVVEHAERFGLAQLHQLRGRVGRGRHASYCLLLYRGPLSDIARARLDAVASTTDGFALAERDLELRGPGDFFGTRQSGLPELRAGQLVRDHAIMVDARRAALDWLAGGGATTAAVEKIRATWPNRFGLVGVG